MVSSTNTVHTMTATPKIKEPFCPSGENFQNATALVITFVVNNHLEDSANAKAMAWEKAFISFMKNYTKHQPNMSIAFSSEVGAAMPVLSPSLKLILLISGPRF